MKFSKDFVWKCIGKVNPLAIKVRNNGICDSLPELLKDSALRIFMMDDFDASKVAYQTYVIKTAMKELQSEGFLTFGTVNEEWM